MLLVGRRTVRNYLHASMHGGGAGGGGGDTHFNSIFPKFLQASTVDCVANHNLICTCGRNTFCFALTYDPSRLTGRKTSTIYLLFVVVVVFVHQNDQDQKKG